MDIVVVTDNEDVNVVPAAVDVAAPVLIVASDIVLVIGVAAAAVAVVVVIISFGDAEFEVVVDFLYICHCVVLGYIFKSSYIVITCTAS
jgi:hypothetical protein